MKVNTKYGEIDEQELVKVETVDGGAHVVEYYRNNELVHRSAVTQLTGVEGVAEAKGFGGA